MVREHDENPGMGKLKNKRKLMQVQRSLEVVQEQSGEFIKPEMECVLVANWDEEDGKFDASKVVEETCSENEKGIWKQVGKHGHLRYREKHATVVRDVTVEEEGSGKFADQAIQAQTEATATVKTAASKAREASVVEAPRLSMATLMSMVSGAAASSTEEAPKETEGSDKEASEEHATSEPESDEDEASAQDHLRLLGHFGHMQGAGGAKPKPPASPAPKSTPQKGQASQKHTAFGQAGSAKQKKKGTDSDANSTVSQQRSVEAPGAGAEHTAFVLDGRGQRLQKAVSDALDQVKADLNTLVFGEEQAGIAQLVGEALLEFPKVVSLKASCLAEAKGRLRSLASRLSRSSKTEML